MGKGAPEADSSLSAGDGRYAIVVARWNTEITETLRDGAVETLLSHGGSLDRIDVFHVPGSFEIPLAADRLASSGKYAAVICLGAVIQGETMHHDYINLSVAQGLMQAGQKSGVPVIFGVLTVKNYQQALDRAGGPVGHKGKEAAAAALEMVAVLRKIDEKS